MSPLAPRDIAGLLISPFRPSEILQELQPKLNCPLDPVPFVPTRLTVSLLVGSWMSTLPLAPPVVAVRLTVPLPLLSNSNGAGGDDREPTKPIFPFAVL